MWDGLPSFVLLSSLPVPSQDLPLDLGSCDNINKLFCDFHTFSMDSKTHINMLVNNSSKEFVNYWLYSTATENNWFDKGCQIGWDYFKNTCITTPIDSNSTEQLIATANNKLDSLVLGLACLTTVCAIFGSIYYNLDTLKDICIYIYMHIDISLYNLLCMFDFPGFMVDRQSIMPLGPDYELQVEHFWKFNTDPGDGILRLVHLATYRLHHEYFWFEFNSLSPGWSIPSYATLTLVPGLDWPFNYDHFHCINLF